MRLWGRLAFLFFLGLGVRSLSLPQAFRGGNVHFLGNDGWYQMRRIEFAARHNLALPDPDPYLNYPEGGRSHWGPLFSQGIALTSTLLGVDPQNRHALETFAAWVPAVLGALCVLVAYGIGALLLGPPIGLAAGILVAILPAHVEYSLLGNLDHHVAESLLFGLASLLILRLRGLKKSAGTWLWSREEFVWTAAGGAVLWLLFLLLPSVAAMYAGLLWVVCLGETVRGGRLWPIFALPALLLIPSALSSLQAAGEVQRFSAVPRWLMFEQFSFFQPLLLAFCAVALKLIEELEATRRADAPAASGPRLARLSVYAVGCGALAVLLAWPVAAGLQGVLRGSLWIKYIGEYHPLLMPYADPVLNFSFAFKMCSYLFPAFPFLYYWIGVKEKDPFVWIWPLLLFVLVMLQLRYIYLFAYPLALLIAAAAVRLSRERPGWKALIAIALLIVLWPCGRWLWSLSAGSPFRYPTLSDQDYAMLQTLGQKSPPTVGYDNASERPEYGVLAPWGLGHAVVYLARRPVVADPFGHGVEKEARYYTAQTPAQALAVLRENRARYVVGEDVSNPFLGRIYADVLALPETHPLRRGQWDRLFQMRLLASLPVLGPDGKPSAWGHKLLYRSPEGQASLYEFTDLGALPAATPSKPKASSFRPSRIPSPAQPARPVPQPVKPVPPTSPIVASIGDKGRVSEKDLADFIAAESCYGSDALNSRKAGFMRMLETAIMEEVMRREAGLELTKADYEKEGQRIDRETRAPEILECVKKYFTEDGRGRYERVFLRKNMIAGPFHRFLQFDPKVQKQAYNIRDQVLAKSRQGESFVDLAAELKIGYSTRTYTLEEPREDKKEYIKERAAAPSPTLRWSPFEKQFIEDHLKALAPGQMKPEPVDSYDIQFFRLLSNDDGRYRFESLRIDKKNIRDYFSSIPKLRCAIKDPELKEWIRGIPGNPMLSALDLE